MIGFYQSGSLGVIMKRYSISECICPECGSKMFVPRKLSRKRERGHVKDIYCPFCKKVVKMLEVRDGDFYSKGTDTAE